MQRRGLALYTNLGFHYFSLQEEVCVLISPKKSFSRWGAALQVSLARNYCLPLLLKRCTEEYKRFAPQVSKKQGRASEWLLHQESGRVDPRSCCQVSIYNTYCCYAICEPCEESWVRSCNNSLSLQSQPRGAEFLESSRGTGQNVVAARLFKVVLEERKSIRALRT